MSIKKDFPQGEGIRLRYVKELERLKVEHGYSLKKLANLIGYQRGETLSNLIAGRLRISLEYIVLTLEAFPDFDLMYVLKSEDMPKVNITTFQGIHEKGVPGEKRTEKLMPISEKYNEMREIIKKIPGDLTNSSNP